MTIEDIKNMKPPEVRKTIIDFMVDNGEDREIIEPLFVAPGYLWRMITVVQSTKVHPEGMVGNHTLKALYSLRVVNSVTLWATLFHDIGKIKTTVVNGDKVTSYGHEKESEALTRETLQGLRMNPMFIDRVCFIVGQHMRVKRLHEMRAAKFCKLVNYEYFELLKEVAYADSMAGLGDLTWYNFIEGLE